jgi:hypothetical protein
MSDKKSLSNSNINKKRKRHSDDESKKSLALGEDSQENQKESDQHSPPPEKKRQAKKSNEQRKTKSPTKETVDSHDPMILSQEERKNDVLEEFPKKSSREFWTTEVHLVQRILT